MVQQKQMKRSKNIAIVLLLMVTATTQAQNKTQILSPDNFIQLVKLYHPLAKQANIQVQKADAELLAAKGMFDPTLAYTGESKTFDGKNYFFYNNPELKIPTALPFDIKTGVENNGGINITDEATTGRSSYLGIEMQLAKGLVIDKRRAALQQAKIYRTQSEQERLKMVNDLLFDAYVSYWQWAGNYQLFAVYSKFLEVSNNRLRLVRVGFFNGDRSIMDTVEAFTQIQNFQLLQTEALQKLNNARFDVSNYLWLQNDSAYILPAQFVPDTVQFALYKETQTINDLINRSNTENPNLLTYNFKLNSLEVERKLKFQSLLPTLNVRANLLNEGYYVGKNVSPAFFQNNNKWGVDFKIPLFLREGRGDYQKAKLKIKETNLELNNKRWEVENKIRYYFNENTLLQQQIITAQSMYKNYNMLLQNENLRFEQGESSLFLVNSRENKVIESLQKIIDLRIKYFKASYAVEWAAGLLR
jgi:outer membrane protein TolC